MSRPLTTSTLNTRASYTIKPNDVADVICHRKVDGIEQYLIRWKTKLATSIPPDAPCSWHPLLELWDALHHVQTYVEIRPRGRGGVTANSNVSLPLNRKRKLPDVDLPRSRDFSRNGFLSEHSRSPTVFDVDAGVEVQAELVDHGPQIYNAILQKKAGHLVAKQKDPQLSDVRVATTNAKNLPSAAMIQTASNTPVNQAERMIRQKFLEMLRPVKGVNLENKRDSSTPSLNFEFISEYVLRDGVPKSTVDSYEGCDKCRPDMGQNIGCEYTQKCGCLEYAAVDEIALERRYPELYDQYLEAKETGAYPPDGLPKRFPYTAPNREGPKKPQRLVTYYLDRRHPIYECNQNCRCGPRCKSRLVQKGRRVPLTIFKTKDRGWGVYCNEDLIRGEFIDTYVGEVITSEEADRRESKSGQEKESYLYTLNKFVGGEFGVEDLTDEDCFVVDGQYKGGATRFINHSCDPNCRQYTVHYDKNNLKLYNLAFFAYGDIAAGTELTFDYQDLDEEEEEVAIRKRQESQRDPANKDKVPCICGAKKCRGFLWL